MQKGKRAAVEVVESALPKRKKTAVKQGNHAAVT